MPERRLAQAVLGPKPHPCRNISLETHGPFIMESFEVG